jgi:hypothetical protein
MWANPWIVKEIGANVCMMFFSLCVLYYVAEAFAKVTYRIHKKRMLKNK